MPLTIKNFYPAGAQKFEIRSTKQMQNSKNELPRRKQRGIARHAGLDPASRSLSSGFRLSPE